jgi:hypothetical protein
VNGISWKINNEGETTKVALAGSVDEEADFKGLIRELSKSRRIRLDVGGVGRINSCGVREWINFIRAMPTSSALEIENFTPALVSQLNMINNFVGSAKVLSVHAPYVCPSCGREESVVVDVSAGGAVSLGAVSCPSCKEQMEFDDLEDSYFAFLQDAAIAR